MEINELIDAALRRYSFNSSLTRSHVEQAYRDVVGEFIVKLTRSVRYDTDSHTLRVHLSATALKNELTYKINDLRDAINTRLQSDEVKKIVII